MHNYTNYKFEVKSFDENTGEFEGIASAYRKRPDKVDDIVDQGAFTKTIADNNGEIMLTFPPHDTDSPVGIAHLEDTEKGLKVKGKLIDGIQKAREAYLLMKAGVIKTLSIGYQAVKWEMRDGVRHLKEVKLYEVGLVPGSLAADDMAVITGIKTALEEEIKEGRVISNPQRIKNAIEALQDLLEAVEKEPLTSTPKGDTSKTEPLTSTQAEAVVVDRILASLQGFDSRKAETRIDNILKKIKEARNER